MAKKFNQFQKNFCLYCRTYRKQPYCSEDARTEDCPWKDRTPPPRWPGQDDMKTCPCCGKDVLVRYRPRYTYKKTHPVNNNKEIATEFFCGWNCFRKEEKIIERICDNLELSGY